MNFESLLCTKLVCTIGILSKPHRTSLAALYMAKPPLIYVNFSIFVFSEQHSCTSYVHVQMYLYFLEQLVNTSVGNRSVLFWTLYTLLVTYNGNGSKGISFYYIKLYLFHLVHVHVWYIYTLFINCYPI